eukprot:1585578-Pyramimonas_sp.AAC.1
MGRTGKITSCHYGSVAPAQVQFGCIHVKRKQVSVLRRCFFFSRGRLGFAPRGPVGPQRVGGV